MVILVLAVTACALCVWVLVQDRQQSPVQVPQAHYQPLPEPSPTVTVVPVTISDANGAAICIIPTGKPRKNIELARVP